MDYFTDTMTSVGFLVTVVLVGYGLSLSVSAITRTLRKKK